MSSGCTNMLGCARARSDNLKRNVRSDACRRVLSGNGNKDLAAKKERQAPIKCVAGIWPGQIAESEKARIVGEQRLRIGHTEVYRSASARAMQRGGKNLRRAGAEKIRIAAGRHTRISEIERVRAGIDKTVAIRSAIQNGREHAVGRVHADDLCVCHGVVALRANAEYQ